MALPISLGRSGARSTGCHPVDVVLQSRTSKHGIGRHHPKTAAGHGRIAFLLLAIAKNGGITNVFNEVGIPALTYGPRSAVHSHKRALSIESLYQAACVYARVAVDICSQEKSF